MDCTSVREITGLKTDCQYYDTIKLELRYEIDHKIDLRHFKDISHLTRERYYQRTPAPSTYSEYSPASICLIKF